MKRPALVALLFAVPFFLAAPSLAGTIQTASSFTVNGTVASGQPFAGDAFTVTFGEPSGGLATVTSSSIETDNVPVTYTLDALGSATVSTDITFWDLANSGLFDLGIGNLDLSLYGPQIFKTDASGNVNFMPGTFAYGSSSALGPSGVSFLDYNLNFAPGTVTVQNGAVSAPEPATLGLLALGLVGLFAVAWRRRSPSAAPLPN